MQEAYCFFRSSFDVLDSDDVIVFGCYDPNDSAVDVMSRISTEVTVRHKLYTDTVALNSDEYPRGRVFTVRAKDLADASLQELFAVDEGELLFFDHALGFRISNPIVPLFMFHGANFEDEAELSGHYYYNDLKAAFVSRGLNVDRVLSAQVNPKR